jgi:hypothetical protein
MRRLRYTLIDQGSLNELGHFDTVEKAAEARARFAAQAPDAAADLEIWDEDEDERVVLEPDTVRPAPAA